MFLINEHQCHQQRQVQESISEQPTGRLGVGIFMKLPCQVHQPRIDRKRVQGKEPGGEVAPRCQGANRYGCHAVAQGNPLAEVGMADRHHAITSPGVICPQTPAKGIKVGKLPGIQDAREHERAGRQRPCARCPAHERRYGTHDRPYPCVDDANSLEGSIDASVQEYVGKAEVGRERVDSMIENESPTSGTHYTKHGCMPSTGRQKEREGEEKVSTRID